MITNAVEVLLVEDNLDDAELTILELKKNKLANNLVHVRDGQEALDFLFATGKFEHKRDVLPLPKVILLDIQMPRINGLDVLKKIRSDPRTSSAGVVILTSSDQDPDIQKCYALGASSYIIKPVEFDAFTRAVRNMGLYWLLLNEPPV